jgi:hypothetical protein
MKNAPVAEGLVTSLSINGESVKKIQFEIHGPQGDTHSGFIRTLSGHDGEYIKTSDRTKGDVVFNWRTWTALSLEELALIGDEISAHIPQGILLENIIFYGIPNFSKLTPGSRLVLQSQESQERRPILAVWEENAPCATVGKRLEEYYKKEGLKTAFVASALGRRGVMGFVLAPGIVEIGDKVLVYPPVQ